MLVGTIDPSSFFLNLLDYDKTENVKINSKYLMANEDMT